MSPLQKSSNASEPRTRFGIAWYLSLLTLPLYAGDQYTKWLVLQHIGVDDLITVIPDYLFLVQAHNTGAAFSMLEDNNGLFIVISLVALLALGYFFRRGAFQGFWMRVGASLLLAGVLGNLTDRILHGHVIDFVLVNLHFWPANPWPVFNVADSCICIAAAIFVIRSFFEPGEPKRPEK